MLKAISSDALNSSDVTAASNLTNNQIVVGDGGGKGVKTNHVNLTDPGATGATMALAAGSTFSTSGAFSITFTAPTNVNATLPNAANVTVAGLQVQQAYTAQQNFAAATLTSSSNAVAWNLQTAQTATLTMTENTTISAPTNLVNGGTYILKTIQDSTPRTLAFNSAFKFPGGIVPSISTGSGAVDVWTFYCDGTNMYSNAVQNFS